MAFPTPVPAAGTVHTEQGKKFCVENGRWTVRPGARIHISEGTVATAGTGTGIHASLPAHDKATSRLTFHCAFQMETDGDVKINVIKNSSWLSPSNTDHWAHGSGSLSNGSGNWRRGNWADIKAPESTGYWLNWAYGDWKCSAGKFVWLTFDIHQFSGEWSACQWLLVSHNNGHGTMRTLGSIMVHAIPPEIRRFVINSNGRFSSGTVVTEAH